MIEDASTEEPKKRKGWPKGKPRGPRKAKDVTGQATVGQGEPPRPQRTAIEPVSVNILYKTGQSVNLFACEFDISGNEYRFWSYPPERGFKMLSIVQKSEVVAISIDAPEMFFDRMKAQPAPIPVASPAVPGIPSADPARYVNGDPQISVAPRGRAAINRAKGAGAMGLPRAEVTMFEKGELVETPVGASMV